MENNWNRPKDYTNQRDTFIGDLFQVAKNDKDVILISVDMGASALDQWREELPEQFIWTGISEQHTINLAAGLANQGKKVYIYFMAAWLARCFEQIRYSCAMAKNPITLLANGVALGYAPAGPAHETNDDIAYMRSILDLEIHCPTNLEMVKTLVNLTYEEPKLRCIRLERHYAVDFDEHDVDLGGETLFINDPLIQGIVPKKHRLVIFADDVWHKATPFRDKIRYTIVFKYK